MAYKLWTTEVITSSDVDTYLMRQAVVVCTSGTRPPGVTGMRIWETDTQEERYYNGSSWVYIKEENRFALKTVDEARSNTDDINMDSELFLPIDANTTYFFDAFIIYSSPTSVGLQMGISAPNDTSFYFTPNNNAGAPTYSVDRDNIMYTEIPDSAPNATGFYQGWGTSLNGVSWIRDIIVNTGNLTGVLGIHWAQSPADLSETTIRANSYIQARRAPS